MARKHAKEESIDFFYLQQNEKENTKKRATKNRPNQVAKKKNTKKKKGQAQEKENDIFNFDNEIVIGVNVLPDEKQEKKEPKKKTVKTKNTNKNKGKQKKQVPSKQKGKTNQKKKGNPPQKKMTKAERQKRERRGKILKLFLKIFILLAIIAGVAAFLLVTPIFNIAQIQVEGNEKITKETIQSLSGLQIGENIFRFQKSSVEANIKQEPYIQEVEIQRNLPNTIVLKVTERHTKYVIEVGNGYLYLNNQGYFLEISDTKPEVPILRGYTTKVENLVPGNRLDEQDLEKMETVIRIMDSAEYNEIGNLVTAIAIQDKNNYTLYLDSEGKTVYLGDASNLNDKMWILKQIIEREKGKNGEVFLKENNNYFFRENVNV